jgi:hypothetical protein
MIFPDHDSGLKSISEITDLKAKNCKNLKRYRIDVPMISKADYDDGVRS